jgi:type 1 glutamine amidotransferase
MRVFLGSLVSLGVLFSAWHLAVAEAPAKDKAIRVLLTVGGHGFEEVPFYAMWDSLPGVKWTKIELPKQADLLKPGLEKQYDVIAMYDMCPGFTPEQQQAFVALLNKGIGVVSLHHNLGGHQKWDEFRKIIGGKFCIADSQINGVLVKQSTWDHDQDLKVAVVDKDHPITKGIEDFQIHDESYGGCWISPEVKVLLKTDHPKNKPGPVAWVTKYGNSPVAYIMLGHDSQAWKNPNYPKLLLQAIQWAARR